MHEIMNTYALALMWAGLHKCSQLCMYAIAQ